VILFESCISNVHILFFVLRIIFLSSPYFKLFSSFATGLRYITSFNTFSCRSIFFQITYKVLFVSFLHLKLSIICSQLWTRGGQWNNRLCWCWRFYWKWEYNQVGLTTKSYFHVQQIMLTAKNDLVSVSTNATKHVIRWNFVGTNWTRAVFLKKLD
jgi:hypothetical protein